LLCITVTQVMHYTKWMAGRIEGSKRVVAFDLYSGSSARIKQMPKSVLDTLGITIRRGASPKIWATRSVRLSLTSKETSQYLDKDRYRAPKKGNYNA